MKRGESYTIAIVFNDDYDLTRLEDIQLSFNTLVVGTLKQGSIYHTDGHSYRCEVPGEETSRFRIGQNTIEVHVDDSIRGIIKRAVGTFYVDTAYNKYTDESINLGVNMFVEINISETDVTTDFRYFDAIRGESAYEAYVKTTLDDPPLSKYEWSNLNVFNSQSIDLLNQTKADLDGGNTFTGDQTITGEVYVTGSLTATGDIIGTNLVGSADFNTLKNKPTLVSGSSQVVVQNTTGIERLATTGSNLFTGNQTVEGMVQASMFSGSGELDNLTVKQTFITPSVQYTELPPTSIQPRERYWSEEDQTTLLSLPDGGSLNDGQELGNIYVNVDTIPLTEGMFVSVVPLSGNRKGIRRTDPASKESAENVAGMVTVPSIPINGKGRVTSHGHVSPLDTRGYVEDAVLYVSHTTPGAWTLTPPPAGYYTIKIGTIVVSANQGTVNVAWVVYPKMEDLSDVTNNAEEGQPLTKLGDGTWTGRDTLKITELLPRTGTLNITGSVGVSGDISASSLEVDSISVSGSIEVDSIQSTEGFIKPGSSNEEFLMGGGGTLPVTDLKESINTLYRPNTSQSVATINSAGQLIIDGDIIQNGQAYNTHAENISTPQETILLRSGSEAGLGVGEMAGFVIQNYDGENDGMTVIDKDGVFRIGDSGSLQPVMTREESPIQYSPLFFNQGTLRAETLPGTTVKTTPVDGDSFMLKDSADENKPKWLSFLNLKTGIKTYLDPFYLQLINTPQTVNGKITYTQSPTVPTPSSSGDAANRGYVVDNFVPLSGSVVISDVKTFTSSPIIPGGATGSQAVNYNQMSEFRQDLIEEVESIVGIEPVEADADLSADELLAAKDLAVSSSLSASGSAYAALTSELKSEQWAENPEDVEVEAGKYSAKHWAIKAETTAAPLLEATEAIITNQVEIRALENVINSANINQETTTTATGVDTIALPKTAANTGMQVQLFGQSATQLVTNGNFANGTTGWTVTGGGATSFTTLNDEATILTAIQFGGIQQMKFNSLAKFYYSVDVKATTGIRLFAIGTNGANLVLNIHSGSGLYENFAGILNVTSFSSGNFAIQDIRTSGYNPFYVKNAKIINLTATFGAGNEPTKEQCDVLFANYFEGSDNVLGTGRVRSVGNNLIKPTYIQGFRVQQSSGLFIASALYSRSDYFRVAPNTAYILSSNDNSGQEHAIVFYDKNKTYITGIANLVNNPISVTSPANAYYCIVSSLTTKVDTFRLTRSTSAFEPYRESILQLTTPELRSNGLIKDEIRKGTNGYELVRRVGVGTLGSEKVSPYDFTTWTNIGNVTAKTANSFTIGTSGAGVFKNLQMVNGKYYKISISGTWVGTNIGISDTTGAVGSYYYIYTSGGSFSDTRYFLWVGNSNMFIYGIGATGTLTVNSWTVKEVTAAEAIAATSTFTEIGSNVHHTLATPTITPISHAGLLNSNSNGTVYFEPIIADAGVYSSNLAVQLTDYPIASFESIRKYANGTYTELNIATAVIAGNGLSFTHPNLASGDLVMFTYAYNKESICRSMTLTHYDSRFVEADTANGKVYRIVPVVTNGVVSWTTVEV